MKLSKIEVTSRRRRTAIVRNRTINTLTAARNAAAAGDHDLARSLFAQHGISYVTGAEIAAFNAARQTEGN